MEQVLAVREAPTGQRTAVGRWCGGIASATMAVAGAFHLLWTLTPWPLENWLEFNRTIMGSATAGAGVGTEWVVACCIIASLLLAAAYIVGTRAGLFWRLGPWWAFRIASWVIVMVFLFRGVMGLLADVPADLPAHHWNLVLCSPLCLILAAMSTAAIVCAGVYPRGREAAAGWLRLR